MSLDSAPLRSCPEHMAGLSDLRHYDTKTCRRAGDAGSAANLNNADSVACLLFQRAWPV